MRFPIFTLHAAYITYIISVTLFISGSLSVLLYEVDRQNRDAYVINDAARQRHLSQRIAKLSLYIQNDVEHSNAIDDVKVDTLKQLVNRWQSAYSSLPVTSQLIDSLLKRNGVYQNKIITACEDIISSPGSLLVNEAVKVISEYEQPFLWGMEKIVLTYQLEAEEKLSLLKRILYFIAATAVLLITGGFTWLFLPVTNRLSASNKSLEQLKNYLQLKERQYRELVEVSRDMIYEINNKGKYVYVNPVLESITGYSKEELYTKHYSELILPEHRDEVIKFYKEQREQNQESSYLEFPISGRKNNVVWIGQNVNIISTEDGTWKALVIARDITDLKDTQQKLEENEKLYSLLLKNSHDLVALHDPDGTFKYLSPAVKAMLGYDEEELIDTLAIDLAHPDDRPMLLKALQEDTTTGQPRSNLVFRLKHKQGHYVWGEVSAVPIKDEKQKVKFILTSNRDVTKRMHLEQKLLDSEMLFRSLSENATVGVFRTDPLGNCTYVNARWSYIAGFTNEQAQSGGWMSAIHEEDKPKVVEEWIASIKEDREFSLEYRFIGSGKIFWVQGGSSKYTDSVGNILGYVGTINNITERKVAEKKLFESEELYRLLSENSRDMISLHQPDGTYVFVSASVKELLGFMPGELIDTSPYELIHPDDHKRLQEGPHQNLRKGIGATNIEYRVKKKDGTYIWMNAYTHPVLDCEGNLTSFQTSSRDISAQKEYEFALLAEKQRAEDATKVKSDFLSMMSHEIRTPLNGIIGMANILAFDNPKPEQEESIRLLRFSGENLLTIINDILDFNKIEAGKVQLEKISFSLFQLMQDTLALLDARCREKGIKLHFRYEADQKIFIGDPIRINQIINNLVTNAIKFTEHGTVSVNVKSEQQQNSRHTIAISITDTGIGIADDKLDIIFEGFAQAGNDITRRFGGTGLGLSISKRLAQLMNGDIRVQSTLHSGSTFSFGVPLAEGTLPIKKPADHPEVSQLKDLNVLLVEDNKGNQMVASLFLKKKGLHVIIANHGKEAVEHVKDKSFDLVLMDLQMPEMDGYEATMAIREMEDPYFKKLPIIALTSNLLADVEEKVVKCGMNGCMTKPFKSDELLAIIAMHVHKP